jgi:hypothetical protein
MRMTVRAGGSFAAAVCVSLLVGGGGAATAQDSDQDLVLGSGRAAEYQRVTQTCYRDVARFCPALDQAAATPRDQALCLKPFRLDLTRDCRAALAAVMAAAQPKP